MTIFKPLHSRHHGLIRAVNLSIATEFGAQEMLHGLFPSVPMNSTDVVR